MKYTKREIEVATALDILGWKEMFRLSHIKPQLIGITKGEFDIIDEHTVMPPFYSENSFLTRIIDEKEAKTLFQNISDSKPTRIKDIIASVEKESE